MTVIFDPDPTAWLDALFNALFLWAVVLGLAGWLALWVMQSRRRSAEKREVDRMVEVLRAKNERR